MQKQLQKLALELKSKEEKQTEMKSILQVAFPL